jgi:DNA-binding HxlR family transcriptional regulator
MKPAAQVPMLVALEVVGNKWAVPILYHLELHQGRLRFRELLRALGRVSQKELTRHLRRLERTGLVRRRVLGRVPPQVEYALTPLGRSLLDPLRELACWAERHGEEIAAARAEFDRRAESEPPLLVAGRIAQPGQ